MGVSCLSLSSRAVGKAYSRTGTAESQGWRPAFVRPYAGACMFLPPCPLTDIKRAHPAYPFCSFFIPVSHRKGTGGQIPRPIPSKCTGKKGNSGKSENPRISCICGHRPEMHSSVFLVTGRNGTGNGAKKNPAKSRLPGYFLYIYSIFLYISPIIYIFYKVYMRITKTCTTSMCILPVKVYNKHKNKRRFIFI